MVTMFNPKPQLLRAVDKPDNVSSQEIAKARPVYIDGLPEGGGGGSSTTDAITVEGLTVEGLPPGPWDDGMPLNELLSGLLANMNNIEGRIKALETADSGTPEA